MRFRAQQGHASDRRPPGGWPISENNARADHRCVGVSAQTVRKVQLFGELVSYSGSHSECPARLFSRFKLITWKLRRQT